MQSRSFPFRKIQAIWPCVFGCARCALQRFANFTISTVHNASTKCFVVDTHTNHGVVYGSGATTTIFMMTFPQHCTIETQYENREPTSECYSNTHAVHCGLSSEAAGSLRQSYKMRKWFGLRQMASELSFITFNNLAWARTSIACTHASLDLRVDFFVRTKHCTTSRDSCLYVYSTVTAQYQIA